jgi:hypothetical protein
VRSVYANPTTRALFEIHRSARGFRLALVGSLSLLFGSVGSYVLLVSLVITHPTNSADMLAVGYSQDMFWPGIVLMLLTFVLGRGYALSKLRSRGLPYPELAPIVAFSSTGRIMMARLGVRDHVGPGRAMATSSGLDIGEMVERALRSNRPGISSYIPIYVEAGIVVPLIIYLSMACPAWWSGGLLILLLFGSLIAIIIIEVELVRIRRRTELA